MKRWNILGRLRAIESAADHAEGRLREATERGWRNLATTSNMLDPNAEYVSDCGVWVVSHNLSARDRSHVTIIVPQPQRRMGGCIFNIPRGSGLAEAIVRAQGRLADDYPVERPPV